MKILNCTSSICHLRISTIAHKLQIKTLKLAWDALLPLFRQQLSRQVEHGMSTVWSVIKIPDSCDEKTDIQAQVLVLIKQFPTLLIAFSSHKALMRFCFMFLSPSIRRKLLLLCFLLLMDESQSLVVHDNDDTSYLTWTMLGWRNHNVMRKETLATFFAA